MNKTFSQAAGWYSWKFRWLGLEKVQRLLLEGVHTQPIVGKEVLDIGCGIGGLHLTLLKEGAARATGIDMAEGMIRRARSLAEKRGVTDRTAYHVGDFVEMADAVQDSDITILDKVVCCYEDLGSLVKQSISKTKSIYALSHPKESLIVRFAYAFQIGMAKYTRGEFRTYWHDWRRMKEDIRGLGFEVTYSASTFFWQVVVFKRITP